METKKQSKTALSSATFPSEVWNHAICSDEFFSGCAELCNLSTVLVGRMGGLGVGTKSAVKAHIVVLY